MKRLNCILLALALLTGTIAIAEDSAYDYTQIWESFGVSSSEEMYDGMLALQNELHPEEHGYYTTKHYPCKFRVGATTKELIADKRSWDLAIVSSADVDLQALADKKMIRNYPLLDFSSEPGQSQLLVNSELRALLPKKEVSYGVYFYDVDKAGNAIMLIENGKGKGIVNNWVPKLIMEKRSPEKAREMEGIRRVFYWTTDELLAAPSDWDTALLTVNSPDDLQALDEAGLLYDLAQEVYFASRVPTQVSYAREREQGVFSADGRMIGASYGLQYPEYPKGEQEVIVVNAKSLYLEKALSYTQKFIKGWDLFYDLEPNNKKVTKEQIAEIWND